MASTREIHLKSRPVGLPGTEHFEVATVELPALGAGEVLVKNLYMSVDPYMRGRMYDRPSYVPPFQVGKVLEGGAVGEVVESNDPSLKPGDLVNSMAGWREAFVAPASTLTKLPAIEGVPVQAYLGIMGMPGLTAWSGLTRIGEPKDGETVFVSGGAGAVGSAVAQVARIKGCTVVATAGTGGYQPFEIANGAASLLDEVLSTKITGEEEAYSMIDLLDFEANVEGSLQAFATLEPALNQIDPTIVPQISAAFDALQTELATFKDPSSPSGWVSYDKLTDADKKALTDALLAVQEPLSAVAQKITQ